MQKLLTLNAGSTSIKFAIFDIGPGGLVEDPSVLGSFADLDDSPVFAATGPGLRNTVSSVRPEGVSDHATAWDFLLGWLEEALNGAEVVGAGHRIVHGGPDFSAPVRLNEATLRRLAALSPLAPGHQPHNLAGVAAIARCCPLARQVACFDTAFHRTQPKVEETFAIPRALTRDGVIRYGFHGLSYEYIAGSLESVLGDFRRKRVIVAHLGAGASMCALVDGKSVATTMGFTALDGLPMATRCGSIDPGVVLHLLQERQMSVADVEKVLYRESGLLGLSGVSGDMRVLQSSDAPQAAEAIDYFVYRVVREVGSLAAAMGGVDALVFTAGVGENAPAIREKIVNQLSWLGFALDEDANLAGASQITLAERTPSAWMIPTNEELMIARHAYRLTASAA